MSLMDYGNETKINFEQALKLFEALSKQSSPSRIDQIKLCLSCQKYLENYIRWVGCSPAAATAYQVFVKSTPLWEMLELSSHKWHDWIADSIKETSKR